MSSIALCMIVANAADALDRCLQSVATDVDAIYVTDTGSTDETVQVAVRHKANIRHFPWLSDFSAARNASIADIPQDWILCLDSDDYFPPGEAAKLRRFLDTDSTAFTLDYHVMPRCTPAPGLKLFRNHLGIRYEGIIHEYIRNSLKQIPNHRIDHLNVSLMHTGYSDELTVIKATRNAPMLERELERARKNGDFAQVLYASNSLATACQALNQPARSIQILSSALEELASTGRMCSNDWEIALLANLVRYHNESGNSTAAVDACLRFSSTFGNHPFFQRMPLNLIFVNLRLCRSPTPSWEKSPSRNRGRPSGSRAPQPSCRPSKSATIIRARPSLDSSK